MPVSTPGTLASAAACYCFDLITAEKVKIYLLAQAAGLGSMTPAQLADAAKCYCFDPVTQKKVEAYLLYQVSIGGVAGSGPACGNYSGGQPDFIPATGCGVAVDTSDGHIWWYYSGAWH